MASYPTLGTDPWYTPLENFLGVALNTSTGALNSAAVNTALPNTGSPGTYGDATHVPRFTTDAEGRVTAVTATAITGIPTDSGWTNPGSFNNGWVQATNTVSYRKIGSQVQLRGSVSSGTSGQTAFTLPSGYRPNQQAGFAVANPGGSGEPFVAVTVGGSVQPTYTGGTIYLDSVNFLIG